MSNNIFVGLQRLLPPSPVWVGTVLELHDDDTSTVELPTNQGIFEYSAGVSIGSRIRARGTFVPVGEKAFVRDGVIETRAPSEDLIEFEVGIVAIEASPLTFNGPIPDQAPTEGVAFSVALAGYWTGGNLPLTFSIAAGALPAGMALSATTGVVSGTPTVNGTFAGLVFRATDLLGVRADSNAVAFTVAVPPFILLDTFDTAGLLTSRTGNSGFAWSSSGATTVTVSGANGYASMPAGTAFSSPTFFPTVGTFTEPTTEDIYLECDLQANGVAGAGWVPMYSAEFGSAAAPSIFMTIGRNSTSSGFWGASIRWNVSGVNTYLIGSAGGRQVLTDAFAVNVALTWRLELRAGGTNGRFFVNGALVASSTSMPAMAVTNKFRALLQGNTTSPFQESLRLRDFRVGFL